jgi:pimeloyl-CoA synthetase
MSESERIYKADEVAEIVSRLEKEEYSHTEGVPDTIGGFAKEVVESGTFTPHCKVTAELSLTPRERLSGTREQDMTAMVIAGMFIGSALERDVPMDSALEDAWRDGAFALPDTADTDN